MADGAKRSFEEFKLYYESTEKVTDRRLETNRWNYSICIAILVAIAAIARFGLTTVALVWVGLGAVVVLSVMATLFCALWVGQIRDFKKLNNAKFAVLNEMAPQIEFDIAHPGLVESHTPFDPRVEEATGVGRAQRGRPVEHRGFEVVEYRSFIPKAFAVLFVAILVVLLVVVALNWPPSRLVERREQQTHSRP